jgi:hypothetical protein
MPEFQFVSPSLEAFGPTVEVEVRVSSVLSRILIAQGKSVPSPFVVTAIIDTAPLGARSRPTSSRGWTSSHTTSRPFRRARRPGTIGTSTTSTFSSPATRVIAFRT